jgi:glyceraldehyde 3-phosphate dehydrogenase
LSPAVRPPADAWPWQKLAIDIVLDCSEDDARAHLAAGARRVLRCTPDASRPDITVIYGVNHALLCDSHRSVHGANGAAHCMAPVARVLHYALGISSGIVTVMHPPGIACDGTAVLHRGRAASGERTACARAPLR